LRGLPLAALWKTGFRQGRDPHPQLQRPISPCRNSSLPAKAGPDRPGACFIGLSAWSLEYWSRGEQGKGIPPTSARPRRSGFCEH
jgi:hypothetical protein